MSSVIIVSYSGFHFLLPLGKTICTGSDDASLRVWNPKTGENIHVVKGMYLDFKLNFY